MAAKPISLEDMMAEAGDESRNWLSPFSFRFLFDGNLRPLAMEAGGGSGAALPPHAQESESALVSGRVYPDNRGELNPIFRVPATGTLPGMRVGTGYCIELADGQGQQLRRRCFDLTFESHDGPTDHASFQFLEPYPAATARIRLTHSTAVLAERVVSPDLPVVSVLAPNGGEQWDSVHTISWQASDADGDPLTYSVFYSPDNGQSWRLVAMNTTEQQIRWDTRGVGGGQQARVRVLATDGLNTTFDDSDGPFGIGLKNPTVRIVSPADGATFRRPEAEKRCSSARCPSRCRSRRRLRSESRRKSSRR